MNFKRSDSVKEKEFFETLKKRVNDYFERNEISPYGNANMVLKTVLTLLLYFVPYVLMLTGVVTNSWMIFGMWTLMALGTVGIGVGVMHDANHGSYSKNKIVNKCLGYTANLIGANERIWRIQHNVLHHTYTNINTADEDLQPHPLLRFSPHQQKLKIHQFQHIYIWLFYAIAAISWTLVKDFKQLYGYKARGLVGKGKYFRKELILLILWKAFYFFYALILPLLLIPVSPWFIILCFLWMHVVVGIIFSLIFQSAHVASTCDFPMPSSDGVIENSWAIHQLSTTTNFSPGNKITTWLLGGLNYQVEHHLFPYICHVHYTAIAPIVAETAKEFGLPYKSQKTFFAAILNHLNMLRELGRMEQTTVSFVGMGSAN